ncbi:MAG: pyridoxine 5'-phosphate synthase [Bacteroidaceae bacterium]|nr:pyridoxine 5'-phosphate synthase [Bacteroidaceae bacterium]
MRTKLSVNINKVATVRNARGGNNPDVIKVAKDCELFGADGITVHPRPDERHIRRDDVLALQAVLRTEFNIEGYPTKEFMDLVLRVRPSQVTLVPDKPNQLTSNSGWNTVTEQEFLRDILNDLRTAGIRSSVFIDADPVMAEYAAMAGTDRVELYTGPYAHMYATNPEAAIAPFLETAKRVKQLGIGLNAGHDLSLENLKYFTDVITWVDEVSIGHALICDALYMGLEATIAAYKNCLIK